MDTPLTKKNMLVLTIEEYSDLAGERNGMERDYFFSVDCFRSQASTIRSST